MMRLKPGVRIGGAHSELIFGVVVADQVYSKYGHDLVISSMTEGRHSRTSLHYAGFAADLRINNVAEEKRMVLANEIQAALGPDFDVILESDHIHLEFQPKGPHQIASRTSPVEV